MDNVKIYTEDLALAQSILNRDATATKRFFYQDCYPMFYSIYKNYDTDCKSCLEFISEIYMSVMAPSKKTGHCQLENFRGESSLKTWLKVTCLYYCYGKHESLLKLPTFEPIVDENLEEQDDIFDRFTKSGASIMIDQQGLNERDVNTLLSLMPNRRYRELIRLHYIEQLSNEDTAQKLGMSMSNYYNNHLRAKQQFMDIYRKEESHE